MSHKGRVYEKTSAVQYELEHEEEADSGIGDSTSDEEEEEERQLRATTKKQTSAQKNKKNKKDRRQSNTKSKSTKNTSSDEDSLSGPNSKRKNESESPSASPNKKAKLQLIDLQSDDEEDKSPKIAAQPTHYVSKAPFYQRPKNAIIKSIKDSLSGIMYQDCAIEQVFHRVYARVATPSRSMNPTQRILSLHLTGGSGIGKTETVKLIAEALGMGPGGEYSHCYDRINLGNFGDQSHVATLVGAAPGLIGHKDKNFVTKLKEMITPAKNDKDEAPPPFILLHFDEACKAHPAFVNALNPLLSEGTISDVKSNNFTIPNETLLIIIWTSNFAGPVRNANTDTDAIVRIVYQSMLDKGYDHCDIGRMGGDPIFYKPLTTTEMYNIIEKNGNARLPLHVFCQQFSIPTYKEKRSSRVTEDAQSNLLILNIMKTYKPELGVRHPLDKYMTELDSLLSVADIAHCLGSTDGVKKSRKMKADAGPPVYWCRQIKITDEHRDNPAAFLDAHPQIAIAIKQSYRNKDHLRRILTDTTQSSLEYVVLKYHADNQKILAYSILQPVTDTDLVRPNMTSNMLVASSNSLSDMDTDDAMSSADQDTIMVLKLQNEVFRNQVDTLSKEFKTLKCQMNVILTTDRIRNEKAMVHEKSPSTTSFW